MIDFATPSSGRRILSKGYKNAAKAASVAQLDSDRTNRSGNSRFSRFSKLSSGLTSRASTSYKVNNNLGSRRNNRSFKNEY